MKEEKEESSKYRAFSTEIDTSLFFKKIMQNSTLGSILILDMDGTILDMNVGVRSSFGYNKNDIVGKNFSLLFIPRDRKRKMPEIELTTVLQKGSASDENYVVHKDGSHLWVKGESVLAYGPGGEIFIVKMIYEINQQKLMEKHLISTQDTLEGVLETVPDPVVLLNSDLKVIDANRAFCYAFGIDDQSSLYDRFFFDIEDGMWSFPQMKHVLKEALKKSQDIEDYLVEYKGERSRKQTLSVNIRLIESSVHNEKLICIAMKAI